LALINDVSLLDVISMINMAFMIKMFIYSEQ